MYSVLHSVACHPVLFTIESALKFEQRAVTLENSTKSIWPIARSEPTSATVQATRSTKSDED
jgi:hypothetical protein